MSKKEHNQPRERGVPGNINWGYSVKALPALPQPVIGPAIAREINTPVQRMMESMKICGATTG